MNPQPLYDYWASWFKQPEAEKMKRLRTPGKGGYYPPNTEQPGYTGTPDSKEYFHWRCREDYGLSDELDEATRHEFVDCLNKADAWCNEHGLTSLVGAVKEEDCVLRIIHYPPTPDGNVGQAHVDFDLLTVSIPGTVPGLEVWDPRPRYPDLGGPVGWEQRESFEVHVGEMLQIYTADKAVEMGMPIWLADRHRVRTPPNTERLKAVFFYLPPDDFELRPGFTARDYLNDVLGRAGTREIGVKP